MLQIDKAESKDWILTLTEKVTISPAYFLFSFTHRLTNTITNKVLTDISAYTERYNKFSVTEGTTFTLYTGEYQYKVYAQTSPTNTDPNLADELVEQGLLKVNSVELPEVMYEPT